MIRLEPLGTAALIRIIERALADPQRGLGVLLHQEHRHVAAGPDFRNSLEQLVDYSRSQPHGRFIEQ